MKDIVPLDKYQKNVIHAEAVQDIGCKIQYWLEDTDSDIESYSKMINDRIVENAGLEEYDPNEDWQIRSWYETLENKREKKSLWKKLQAIIDKELAF